MTVINTNINSLNAQYALGVNARAQSKAMLQLSSGSRINSAAEMMETPALAPAAETASTFTTSLSATASPSTSATGPQGTPSGTCRS